MNRGLRCAACRHPPIPDALNVEVGNIIQNLRAPLDKALSAIALQSYPTPKGVQFPFGDTQTRFEDALAKQTKLPDDAKAIIQEARPYKSGNPVLHSLNSLSIPDKHHPDLVPISVGALFYLETIIIKSGELYTIGPSGPRLTGESDLGFPILVVRANLAHAHRNIHHSHGL